MHPEYFQAIIQLRNPSMEAEKFLVENLGQQISKYEKVRNGVDYYVKDKKRAEQAGRKLRDEFGGQFTVSPSLHTRDHQTSKNLYRLNILVRLPGFAKGDVIKTEGKLLKITGLGKKISGEDLKTCKKEVMHYPDDFEVLERHTTRVVSTDPVEVLHPETYQPVTLQNPKDLKVDEKVKIVVDKGVWLV